MGGGKQEAPKTYSPMEQAQAQAMLDKQDAERKEASAAAERQRQEAAQAAQRSKTAGLISGAYQTGTSYGAGKAKNLGFDDTYGLLDTYNTMLNTERSKIPDDAANPGSYFDYNDLWNKSVNDVTAGQKSRLDNQYRNMTKAGWQEDYFADTADDSILDAILGTQYSEAFDTMDAARARGQLSQGAFDNSLRGLEGKKSGARAKLEDLGLGILGGYRDQLSGIADGYNNQITNYKLGQNISMDDMSNSLNTRKGNLSNRMSGDIYNALGDTALFSTDGIMAKGNSSAGVSNNPLRNAFLSNTGANDPNRTTGTTGVF